MKYLKAIKKLRINVNIPKIEPINLKGSSTVTIEPIQNDPADFDILLDHMESELNI